MESCAHCGADGSLYHTETYRMPSGEITTEFYACPNNHVWAACPWCDLPAQREDRQMMSSTDDGGFTVIETWRCAFTPGHRWTVALTTDALSEEMHRELEDNDS